MPRYEYKLVPAPERAEKVKGLKGAARFAATLEQAMNALGAEGWLYLRADTLPQEERSGLTSKQVTYRNILVFMREVPDPVAATVPAEPAAAEPTTTVAPAEEASPPAPPPDPDGAAPEADPPGLPPLNR